VMPAAVPLPTPSVPSSPMRMDCDPT